MPAKWNEYLSCSSIGPILGPCLGHIRAMFGPFLYNLCFQMPEMAKIFTIQSCMPNRRILFKVQLLGPYWGHIWAILGPCLGYLYKIFACGCLKLFKCSLKSHAYQIEEYPLMFNYWDHIWGMFGLYQGHVLAISTLYLLLYA